MSDVSQPRVTLLLSDKSSGSTIFQYELLKHKAMRAVPWTMHNDHETLYWVKAACLLDMPQGDFYQDRVPHTKREARNLIGELLRNNVPGFEWPESPSELVFQGWDALCEGPGHFFEKSPHHLNNWAATSLLLQYVLHTDHDVRVVALVRNPMAVIYSTWSRWLADPATRQYLWAETMRNLMVARRLIPSERFHILRYEDLIENPVEEMAKVCDFLDLERDDEVGAAVHAKSSRKWVDDERFTFTLDPTVAAIARTLGYDDEDFHNPVKPARSSLDLRKERAQHFWHIRKHRLVNRYLRPLLRQRR